MKKIIMNILKACFFVLFVGLILYNFLILTGMMKPWFH